jgi:hypothetical protein
MVARRPGIFFFFFFFLPYNESVFARVSSRQEGCCVRYLFIYLFIYAIFIQRCYEYFLEYEESGAFIVVSSVLLTDGSDVIMTVFA